MKTKKWTIVRWDYLLRLMVAEAERRDWWAVSAPLYVALTELRKAASIDAGIKQLTGSSMMQFTIPPSPSQLRRKM